MFNQSFFYINRIGSHIWAVGNYRIGIGLHYIMKILDWVWTAKIFDPFHTSRRCAARGAEAIGQTNVATRREKFLQ